MEFTAKKIAKALNGKIIGDPNVKVNNISKIEEGKINTLSFLSNPIYEKYLYSTESSIVLINKDLVLKKENISPTLIVVEDSYKSFADLLNYIVKQKKEKTGISKNAFINKTAKVGKNTYIGDGAYIGENVRIGKNVKICPQTFIDDNVTIGDGTRLFAGVKVYFDSVIKENCIIHAGAVIGSDGFGFAPQSETDYKKIPQLGNVIIEENVEIGANTTIDRATMGSTIIRKGVKLDNLIQIAHNVEIGENTVMAAQSGVSGSTKVGKNCMIGGQVGIAGHLTVADNVKIAAQSGIGKSITKAGEVLQGSPAFDIKSYQKSYVIFRNLSKK